MEWVFAQLVAGRPLDEDAQHGERERALAKARKDLEECPVRDTRFNPEARHTTPAQTRELQRRDGYRCSTPGCPHHLYLEVHHIRYYSHGGETVPQNLTILCSACHRNVHEGRLRIEGTPGQVVFLDGQGRNLQRQWRLDVADWLDMWIGWTGGEFDCYRGRLAA
ncbi:HNH endonuclease [bacterium]|nr:HNH endonuclease [bacterium]